MGAYAFVGAAGASIGTLLGGVLTEVVGWRAIFWVNVPIGLAAAALCLRLLAPDASRQRGARPDVLGAVLVTLGLVATVLVIVEPAVPRLAVGALAAALLVGFLVRQARAVDPLVPLSVLRRRSVAAGNLAQVPLVAAMMGCQFATALYLQQVAGLSPAVTGFAMLPVPIVIGAVALRAAGPLIAGRGARSVLLAGLALLLVGFAGLVVWPGTAYASHLLPPLLVLGLGAGLTMPAVTTIAMSGADDDTAGLVSGLANTGQQIGGALGIAVLAAVAAAATGVSGSLASGFRVAYVVAAGLVLASALVTAVALRPRPVGVGA